MEATGVVKKLECRLSQKDIKALAQNEFRFIMARAFVTGKGKVLSNIIWKSISLAPIMEISWQTGYALNWTSSMPGESETIDVGGNWQPARPSEVWDLDQYGYWAPSSSPPKQGCLTVGTNKFKGPKDNGIHIVIGMPKDDGDFTPVFVDPTALGVNMSAWFQASEQLQWWFEAGTESASLISTVDMEGAKSVVETWDWAQHPESNVCYTSYNYADGIWKTQTQPIQ